MIRTLSLAAILLAGPATAQERLDFEALYGNWRGAGELTTLSTGEAQELRCRVTFEAHDGNTRFRGRCASTAGNRRFSMSIVEEGDQVTAQSLLQGDAERDTTVSGAHHDGGVTLSAANGNSFALSPSETGLTLTLVFGEKGEQFQGQVALSR